MSMNMCIYIYANLKNRICCYYAYIYTYIYNNNKCIKIFPIHNKRTLLSYQLDGKCIIVGNSQWFLPTLQFLVWEYG